MNNPSVIAALLHLARYLSRRSVQELCAGHAEEGMKLRDDANFYLGWAKRRAG